MRKFFLLLLSIAPLFPFQFNPDNEQSFINLISCDWNEVEISFSCGRISFERANSPNEDFTTIVMDGAYPSRVVGDAEIPVFRTWIEIPWDATIEIEKVDPKFEKINLAEIGLPVRIYPHQPPVPKIPNFIPQFVINEEFYRKDIPQFSDFVEIIDSAYARDHRIVLLEIRPINYIPSKGELEILRFVRIIIKTPGADETKTMMQKETHRLYEYDRVIAPFILNSEFYSVKYVVPTDVNMIVISSQSDSSFLTNLIRWKRRKGYKVVYRSTTALGGATTTNIKNFIQTEFNNGRADFILLVGDVATIPTYSGGVSASSSDNPYTELSGSDYIPDAFIGRLSLNTTAQITEMSNRTIAYDRFGTTTDTTWTKGVTLPATDDATYYSLAEATQNYVKNTHFRPRGWTRIDTIYAYRGGTGRQVVASVNAGVMLVMYTGHGNDTYWDAPRVTQDSVRNLTNIGKYPFVISFACLTGKFGELSECFTETWIRQTNKGAIGSLGASNNSYWYEDDVMERRMIDSVFITEWMFTSGMRLKGLMAVYASYPSRAEYYFDMYNLLGDPSIALWWNVPKNLVVTHPSTISPGSGSINVTVTSGGSAVDTALVCITNDGSIHSAGYTNMSGAVSLSYSGAVGGETIYITVTAYNKRTYEGTISVILNAPNPPTLVSPFDNARIGSGAISLTPTLTWNVPSDPTSSNLHFKVIWDDDADFITPIDSVMSNVSTVGFSPTPPRPHGTGTCSYVVNSQGEGALVNGTTYWWKVKAYNGSAWSEWSSTRSFTVNTSMTQWDWFQTTDDQFATDILTNMQINSPGSVQLIPGSNTVVQVPTSCADSYYDNAQTIEFYSKWTISGSGNVTVTRLWFYDGNGSLSSSESIKMALYNDGGSFEKIAGSDATIYGTGSTGWLSAAVATPFTITLGSTYWIGVAPSAGIVYRCYRDGSANCSSYPPTGTGSYYQTTDNTLNATVPTSASQSANKYAIPGITYNTGAFSGTILSTAINFSSIPSMASWENLVFSDDETTGDIKYQIFYDVSGTPTIVPDAALSGNSAGFDDSPVSLSGLNTTTYNKLYVKGNFTNSGGTPYLHDWAITWLANTVGIQLLVGSASGPDYSTWALGNLSAGQTRIMNASDRVYVKNTGGISMDVRMRASSIAWAYGDAVGSNRCVLMALFNGTTVPSASDFNTSLDTLNTNWRNAGAGASGAFGSSLGDGVGIPAGSGELLYLYFRAPDPNTISSPQTITIDIQAVPSLR